LEYGDTEAEGAAANEAGLVGTEGAEEGATVVDAACEDVVDGAIVDEEELAATAAVAPTRSQGLGGETIVIEVNVVVFTGNGLVCLPEVMSAVPTHLNCLSAI